MAQWIKVLAEYQYLVTEEGTKTRRVELLKEVN